jgi:hypothetical protein
MLAAGLSGFAAMVVRSPSRRNVKSTAAAAADAHERTKDYLTETELAARQGSKGWAAWHA